MHELLAFAGRYIARIDHFTQVDAEHLAESVRRAFDVPPFAAEEDVERLIARLGIGIAPERLRSTLPFPAANEWQDDGRPMIHLRDGVVGPFAAMTLAHEAREILENAFRRVKPGYFGLDTRDNHSMHAESERFAAALLMPETPMRELLVRTGFDAARIACETRRSLSSVILRIEEITRVTTDDVSIGFWVYEAPWVDADDRPTAAADVAMTVSTGVGAFARVARSSRRGPDFVPARGSRAVDHWLVAEALHHGRVAVAEMAGSPDDPGEFILIAEPLSMTMPPRQILLTAVERGAADRAVPWLRRFDAELRRAGISVAPARQRLSNRLDVAQGPSVIGRQRPAVGSRRPRSVA